MTGEEGRAWLQALVDLAPQLRQQGVFQLELGPLKCRLALGVDVVEAPAPARGRTGHDEPTEPLGAADDPLDDADTFQTEEAPGYPALKG